VELATAEAMAALQAMLLGQELGARGIIFEGDASQVVTTVNSPDPCNEGYKHFVEDI
jgi:hypothetical protein